MAIVANLTGPSFTYTPFKTLQTVVLLQHFVNAAKR